MARKPCLAKRLLARALVLGLDPALNLAERGALLARLAVGSPEALEVALQGIEAGPDRDSPLGRQAIEALRLAAGMDPVDQGGPIGAVTTGERGA